MAEAPPGGRDSPPALPDELVEEVLLRLPPNDPACLLRASLVCKAWDGAVSHPRFRRSLHELHRTPPVLGFLHDLHVPRFVPTTASPFSLDAPDLESWATLDCHHGRALFLSKDRGEILVWEPITGFQRRLPVPPAYGGAELGSAMYPRVVVLCAADGCDHRDCLGGPFRVVFVFLLETGYNEFFVSASVYLSETGTWGEPTMMHAGTSNYFMHHSRVLVGRSLLYFMLGNGSILEYDFARHSLSAFNPPGVEESEERYHLMLTEDGGLCVSELLGRHLKLWTRKVSFSTDAPWVLSRIINLENLLPNGALVVDATRSVLVLAFAEGANVIFVDTPIGVFTIELQSEQVRKVSEECDFWRVVPVVSFYTPVPRGERQSKPSEEAGGEEWGEEVVKTLDQAQQVFDNAIKEGGLVNTFTSVRVDHDFNISALNIHGCILLPKAQEVIDSSGDFSRSAPDEESVKGKSRKADAGNSTTSDSNVECAPPSEIGDSE